MSSESPDPRRFSIRLPRPLWIGLTAVVVFGVAGGLWIGAPIYRKQMVIREIERLGGAVRTQPGGPEWLRGRMADKRITLFDDVVAVYLEDTRATDVTLGHFGPLTKLSTLYLDNTQVTDAGL